MQNQIANLLKKVAMVNKTQTHGLEYQSVMPFLLVGQDGVPFTVLGRSKGCFFSSSYFTVVSLDEGKLCAVLEVLYPCCCGGKLFRTEARVHVDVTRFCSIQIVAKPTFDYLRKSYITTDQICLPFTLTKNTLPQTICRIERKEIKQTGTISIHYTGPDPEVELIIYTDKAIIALTIPKDTSQSMTVCNMQSIEIATPIERVNGMIDIQLNFCEKKNIYF